MCAGIIWKFCGLQMVSTVFGSAEEYSKGFGMYLYVSETFGCIKLVLVFCDTEKVSLEFGAQNFASGVLRRRAVVRRPGGANLHFADLGAPKYISCIFAMHKRSSGVLGARVYVGHCWSAEMYFGEFGAQRCISGIWGRGHVFLEFGGVCVYFGDACGRRGGCSCDSAMGASSGPAQLDLHGFQFQGGAATNNGAHIFHCVNLVFMIKKMAPILGSENDPNFGSGLK